MFLLKIIYAIILIAIGYYIIKYRKEVKGWTGNFVWAEQYLGSGGTYFIIVLIGLACIFFGTLYPFGGLEVIMK
ncbi:MAG: hypothetical protein PHR68_01725 [Candidatus Gracilibacteria bacterium]|nr:hypothetical protein [Candidatus Gracilibacteria bacterium]